MPDYKSKDSFPTSYFPYRNANVCVNSLSITLDPNIRRGGLVKRISHEMPSTIDREFQRVSIISGMGIATNIDLPWYSKTLSQLTVELTPEGEKCEFLRFVLGLIGIKDPIIDQCRSYTRLFDPDVWTFSFIDLFATIGYLCLSGYYNDRCAVLLYDQDGYTPNTGKSLFIKGLSHFVKTCSIDGKSPIYHEFKWAEVRRCHRLVEIDNPNSEYYSPFDAERIAVEDLDVFKPNRRSMKIPISELPRFVFVQGPNSFDFRNTYDCVNIHRFPINSIYSDYYRPYDHFGHALFYGWDAEQWNLFDNFLLECVLLYHRLCIKDLDGYGLGKPL